MVKKRNPIILILLLGVAHLFASDQHVLNTILSYTRLISGLDEPEFEGGRTDFVMVDINGNGHVDILSIGDHGNPGINSDQHGIMIWFNNGEGNFFGDGEGNFINNDNGLPITDEYNYLYGISVGDVNNDGSDGIAVVSLFARG